VSTLEDKTLYIGPGSILYRASDSTVDISN